MGKKEDIFAGIFLLLFSGFTYIQIVKLPKGATTEFGLGFFPTVVTVLLSVLSVVLLFKGVIAYKNKKKQDNTGQEKDRQGTVRLLFMFVAMVIYAIFYEKIGVIFSSYLFMMAIMIFLKVKNKLILLLVPPTVVGLVYLGFTEILNVPLP